MNLQIFVAFSFSLALHLHRINALLYELQTTHHHQASSNNSLNDLILVPTSNEIARQDFVYLFMAPPTNQFAHISMPALEILCYLRMAKIPYYTLSNQFLLASPTGKPQFAQFNEKIFDEPQKIIEEIEKIEVEKSKKPQKVLEKSANEIKMEEALDTIQNIIHADLLTSSRTKNYDGSFTLDGSSQLELWMKDEGLKEQMFLALTKMEMGEDKETGETIGKHSHDEFGRSNLAKNELKFMETYFNMKNRGSEERDIFFVTHGRDFMHFHKMMEVEENEEEEYEDTENELFEIAEVIKKKKKNASSKKPLLHSSTSGSQAQASNKPQQKHHQSDRERFEELMDKRVEEKLAGELAKLKMSIVEFSKALSQKTIKIPLPTEEETLKKKEKEELEKQNETNKKIENFWDWEDIIQQAQDMKIGSEEGWGKLASALKNLQFGKQIRQFDHKKLEECSEDELLEAFKHAIDVLAPIVRPFSDYEGFLFHKKANATEARLLAILSHLFTASRNILKLGELMAYELRDVAVYKHNAHYSLDEALISHRTHLPFDWVQKRIFLNENLRILSDYFEMRRARLELDVKTLKALRKRPWSLEGLAVVHQQKYTGPYPFKTNSMEWLPQWADDNEWSEPEEINEKPLIEEKAGPDHKILTEILSKIVYHFWENLKGKDEHEIGKETNYVACRKGLMHIVASYLCKGTIKLNNGKDDAFKWAIFSKKEKDCSAWHLEQFYKLDEFKRQLLEKIFIPMKSIIAQTVDETIGFEKNILGAIKKGMNAQENRKKGKGKMDEPVEGIFMLDLF